MMPGKKGFTLLEVLIVVIIIGILSAIALPQYIATLEKARSSEAMANIGALRGAMDRWWFEQVATQSSYTGASLNTLDVANPNNIIGRFYTYTIADNSNLTEKTYSITATRDTNPTAYWVKWEQRTSLEGRMLKSSALGGPIS